MITCERCGTQNLDGSRYCDECGAAMWLAGKPSRPGTPGNGAAGQSNKEIPATMARVATPSVSAVASQPSAPVVIADRNAPAALVIERGNSAGKQFPLSPQESNIGRWDADGGVFPDVDLDSDDPEAKVSRRHARISFRDGQYAIEDLGSTNGTFVNRGRRLKPGERHPLKDGDEIIVGKTFLRFRLAK
ncbi:MAG TPA: FHA domain-containing protein [Pyrinomonadaceae bacterium]|nr:FHA domain-containing protein [Pyrinomonadaceae bacterium]